MPRTALTEIAFNSYKNTNVSLSLKKGGKEKKRNKRKNHVMSWVEFVIFWSPLKLFISSKLSGGDLVVLVTIQADRALSN